MKKTKKALASLAIIGMVATMAPINAFGATTLDRYAGVNRYETAAKIADAVGSPNKVAILTAGMDANLVDALAAAPFAAAQKAPILLTSGTELDSYTAAELTSLGITKVFITTGKTVIKDAVTDKLTTMGIAHEFVGGADRYETALNLAKKLTNPTGVLVASANDLSMVDSLAVAPIAAANNMAIVLTDKSVMDAGDLAYVKGLNLPTYVIGSNVVVSDSVVTALGATRVGGANRYATNVAVMNQFKSLINFDTVFAASGNDAHLVDALAGAPLAAQTKSPIILADGTVSSEVTAFVATAGIQNVIALGSTSVVPEAVVAGIKTPVPATLGIASVSAINAKQLVVNFNKAVDESSVISSDALLPGLIEINRIPYDSGNKKVVADDAYANLSSDGKTLTLVADGATYFDGTYSLYIGDGIISKDAKDDLGKFSTTFSVSDKTAPTVVGAQYNSATDKIDVTMSEPVEVQPTVTVNNGSPRTLTVNGMGTGLSFNNAWTKGTTVTVRVSGAVDYLNNDQVSTFTQSVKIDMDETALGVTSVIQDKSNVIKVVFNKSISGADKFDRAVNVEGGVAVFRGGIEYPVDVTEDTNDASNRTYFLTIDAGGGPDYAFYPVGKDSATVNVVFSEDSISDVFGNTNEEMTKNVVMNKDIKGPAIVSAKLAASEKDFVVRFDEDIVDLDLSLVTVRFDGVDITGSFTASLSGKAITLAYGSDIPNGTYTIRVGKDAIEDTHGNNNTTQTSNVTVTGSDSVVTVTGISGIGVNEFQVDFSSKVGVSATTPSSYTLNGVALTSTTDIYFTDLNKDTVVIKLDDNSINYSSTAVLRVLKVYDTDGNKLDASQANVNVSDNIDPSLLSASLSGNVLTLNFDEDMDTSINGTTQDLADLLQDIEIKGQALVLTAGDGTAYVSVDGKKVILTISGGTSNWSTVKAYSTMKVKTLDGSSLLVDKNEGNSLKKDLTVNVSK